MGFQRSDARQRCGTGVLRCTDFGIIPTPGISVCYVSACEYLVYARFRFLCYYFGDYASGDDLVKDLAALFLAEQFYGVLEQLRRKLLDNGGGIGIVKQLLGGKISEIHGNTPFRYCAELPCRCLHYSLRPTKWQQIDRQAFI